MVLDPQYVTEEGTCLKRVFVSISGLVQGIGFRPFVYRLAVNRGLKGYVKNLGDAGVDIDLIGREEDIHSFLIDLEEKKPAIAIYTKVDVKWVDELKDYSEFNIDDSDVGKKEVKLSSESPMKRIISYSSSVNASPASSFSLIVLRARSRSFIWASLSATSPWSRPRLPRPLSIWAVRAARRAYTSGCGST